MENEHGETAVQTGRVVACRSLHPTTSSSTGPLETRPLAERSPAPNSAGGDVHALPSQLQVWGKDVNNHLMQTPYFELEDIPEKVYKIYFIINAQISILLEFW